MQNNQSLLGSLLPKKLSRFFHKFWNEECPLKELEQNT